MPRKKKQSKTSNSDAPQSYINNSEEQKKIVSFIDNIIKQNDKITENKNKERLADYSNLLTINSEWLDSFIIMGYNPSGEEMVFSKAKHPQDFNALLMLLKKVFINHYMKSEG